MALFLASASPRRRELLALITPHFSVCTVPIEEEKFTADSPAQLARVLATEKCRAAAVLHPQDYVIGADTVVDCDGSVLGKPRDFEDAVRMLRLLSDREHLVDTGVCIIGPQGILQDVQTTRVRFAPVPEQQLQAYAATGEPYDKAGGYGIQGWAARFITGIDGCYYNVMGFPVRRVYEMLCRLGWTPEK